MHSYLKKDLILHYIQINNPGPHSELTLAEGPNPGFNESQILVRVKATALNRADLMQKYGKYPPPPGESDIPGLEVAGEVIVTGSKVKQFKPGDKIYGLVGSGGYAEICPVEASLAHHIPSHWNYSLAAALPEALTTVYATLYDLGALSAGQTLLIHGAGSGIASLAIQMAKLTAAKVITTVGDSSKIEKALALGADQVIHYKEQDFELLIEDNSVDLIIDFVGGDYFNKHLHLLKPQGKLIQIACLKGSKVECSLALLMQKRLHIIGFVLRSQSIKEKARLWKLAHDHWFNAFENDKIKPVIDSEFDLNQIETALQRMQQGSHFGKIVIRVGK
ncbi:TPA: zinc-binding dehydrogenase [Legionella pneumophila subsp. pneumophila]|uniref:NAD(P)H-quinone oxidoreductase n=1 Tax=Legionella pneumophila TaxID=446 RepID=UPI0009B2F97F|nr:zinc-binding dehydrogenase [Legionella pneumophila]HAT8966077.1 zinc-binding dehydrogenase [Legionella pneumophila subsp. pneumophila]HAT8370643.1 zinc-binding dehydrogenase [Legionella pneumophila]HAT8637205.1 zinc-binding dehydrogenase [Legionella pneumophila]HAT9490266.1 zinc-binding dehydrogenase [Legionella pneumophila subsp. pneumophila]